MAEWVQKAKTGGASFGKKLGVQSAQRTKFRRDLRLARATNRGGRILPGSPGGAKPTNFMWAVLGILVIIFVGFGGGFVTLAKIGGVLAKVPAIIWLILIFIFLWNNFGGSKRRF